MDDFQNLSYAQQIYLLQNQQALYAYQKALQQQQQQQSLDNPVTSAIDSIGNFFSNPTDSLSNLTWDNLFSNTASAPSAKTMQSAYNLNQSLPAFYGYTQAGGGPAALAAGSAGGDIASLAAAETAQAVGAETAATAAGLQGASSMFGAAGLGGAIGTTAANLIYGDDKGNYAPASLVGGMAGGAAMGAAMSGPLAPVGAVVGGVLGGLGLGGLAGGWGGSEDPRMTVSVGGSLLSEDDYRDSITLRGSRGASGDEAAFTDVSSYLGTVANVARDNMERELMYMTDQDAAAAIRKELENMSFSASGKYKYADSGNYFDTMNSVASDIQSQYTAAMQQAAEAAGYKGIVTGITQQTSPSTVTMPDLPTYGENYVGFIIGDR